MDAGTVHFTKEELIYWAVRTAIVAGRLMPGTRLVVSEVAAAMETSTIPVRGALRRLGSEGFVDIRPHTGAFVTPLPVDYLFEVLQVRQVVEELAVRLAVEHSTPEVLTELERLVDAMDEATAKEDVDQFARLNRLFHATLHAASGNRPLLATLDYLMGQSERGQTIFRLATTRMAESNHEHRQLLESIRHRDAETASHLAAEHRQATITALHKISGSEREG